jgi:MFS family permease
LLAGLRDSMIPATRGGRILAAGAMVDSFGSGLFLGAATLYFVGIVHLPAAQVAGAMSAGAVCGLLSPLVVGGIADRYGVLHTYVAVMFLRCLISAAFPLVHDIAGFMLLTCLLTATDRPCSPLLQVIVSEVAGQAERTHTLATIRAARNVGVTAGLLVAGVVLAMRVRAAFTAICLADAASFLVIARMVYRATRVAQQPPSPGPGRAGATVASTSPFRNLRFLLFTAANGVLSLYDTILVAMLPIWVIQQTVLPHVWVPLMLAVNTALTVLLQGYVARFARTVHGALRLVRYTAFALIIGCAFFALAQQSPLVLALVAATGAVLATTLAENIHTVAGWELSDALSPPGARARYLAVFSMGLSGQRIIGPVLLVTMLLPLGGWAWGVLAPVFATSAGIVAWIGRQEMERLASERGKPSTAEQRHRPLSLIRKVLPTRGDEDL